MTRPRFLESETFKALRSGDKETFNRLAANGVDLTDCDLRATDFRNTDLSNADLRGAYLRDADLRGQDLRNLDLEGVSLFNAKISGTYFPENLSAQEIAFSLEHGTRLRTGK